MCALLRQVTCGISRDGDAEGTEAMAQCALVASCIVPLFLYPPRAMEMEGMRVMVCVYYPLTCHCIVVSGGKAQRKEGRRKGQGSWCVKGMAISLPYVNPGFKGIGCQSLVGVGRDKGDGLGDGGREGDGVRGRVEGRKKGQGSWCFKGVAISLLYMNPCFEETGCWSLAGGHALIWPSAQYGNLQRGEVDHMSG